jgi:deazaflavin-dependent oxidoreductase (nitroreductase family)
MFDDGFLIDLNKKILEEFHANEGILGGLFEGIPVLLLTTTGARTGQARLTPVCYLADGDRLAVFASKGGSPTNPDWYHNLIATKRATVEVGTERFDVVAEIPNPEERERLWTLQAEKVPAFAEYQSLTERRIPVVVLQRAE